MTLQMPTREKSLRCEAFAATSCAIERTNFESASCSLRSSAGSFTSTTASNLLVQHL